MANNKDSKKDDKAQTPSNTQTSTQTTATSTAMTKAEPESQVGPLVQLNLPVKVATPEEIDALVTDSAAKLEALATLSTDASLPPEVRESLELLMAQANPHKPGMEEVNATWKIPRLVLAQPTTSSSAKPEETRPGEIFATDGEKIEKPLPFIPLYFHQENVMFKAQSSKVPDCSAPDAKWGQPLGECAKCEFLPFGQQNKGRGEQKQTLCNNQIVVFGVTADLKRTFLVAFGKTSRRAGSVLLGLANAGPFAWQKQYLLSTEKGDSAKGQYHKYKIEPTGKVNSPEIQKVCAAVFALYQANRKLQMAEYYQRIANAGGAAALAEEGGIDHSLLASGLEPEPDLTAPAPSTGATVKTSAKPM